jgi:hypothetical protein
LGDSDLLHVYHLSLSQFLLRQEVQIICFAILTLANIKFGDQYNRDLNPFFSVNLGLHRLQWSIAMRASFHVYLVQLQLSLNAIYLLLGCHLFWPQNLYWGCKRNEFVELSSLPILGIDIFVFDV